MPKTIQQIENELLRIKIIAGAIALILLSVTGFTIWQLPFKIHDAVIEAEKSDAAQAYRDAAKKAAQEAQDAALLARQSAGEANRVVQEIGDIRNKYRQQLEQLPGDLERLNKQLSDLRTDFDANVSLVNKSLLKEHFLTRTIVSEVQPKGRTSMLSQITI